MIEEGDWAPVRSSYTPGGDTMPQSSCWSLSCAALLIAIAPTIGCGGEPTGISDTEEQSAAVTARQLYLVSFTSGDIPANASSLIAAAGGTIVARYNAVGVVLARSASTSFAGKLRATSGVDAVGNTAAVHSEISPIVKNTVKRGPRKIVKPASGDPLSPRQWDMAQIHAPQ